MTTTVSRHPLTDARLCARSVSLLQLLQPHDIRFRGGLDGAVRIEITFRNTTARPSPAVTARIEAAPLGAFVSGIPLAMARVPGLDPGQSWVFTRSVPYTPPTASQGGRSGVVTPAVTTPAGGWAALPPDPFHEAGRGSIHWAGNLNVFVGRESVERHMAKALRVYPGVTNVAGFIVGCWPDAYRFAFRGEGVAWNPEITYALADRMAPQPVGKVPTVVPGRWIDVQGQMLGKLCVFPPADCAEESLDVLITQRSSGRTACVEFSFAPDAEGPGCFTI